MQITSQASSPGNGQKPQQHLTFMMGGEQYAASLLRVKKFVEYDTGTEVLRTWEWIRGMSGRAANSTEENGPPAQTIPSGDGAKNEHKLRA